MQGNNTQTTTKCHICGAVEPEEHKSVCSARGYHSQTTKSSDWLEGYHQALKDAADECERMILYPGGRVEAPKYNNVWQAADGIRAMKDVGL